jgi:streptomycin 6-kinase
VNVSPSLVRTVVRVWGDAGRQWLDDLPSILDEVLRRWGLRCDGALPMSLHWVASVSRDDGSPAVLRLGLPQADHQAVESAVLQAYAGRGAVRLIAHDPERGALLLQRADPGRQLRDLVPGDDERATAAIVAVVRALHAAPLPGGHTVPPLRRARAAFTEYLAQQAGDDVLPRRLVQAAASLFDELVASAGDPVLLHGDLHHNNVLSDERSASGWVAIDPHGWVGDRGFDVGAMLYNPDPHVRSEALLRLVPGRIEQLAAGLDLPVDRVVAWGFVMAMLSQVWTVQDGGAAVGRPLDVARLLEPRLS